MFPPILCYSNNSNVWIVTQYTINGIPSVWQFLRAVDYGYKTFTLYSTQF